jgi:pyruvate-ferredoxin/flavodoxin oxidoreductase
VSSFLKDYDISEEQFREVVHKQYEKKFGRFGASVVVSNMTVMEQGYSRVQEIRYGGRDEPDQSSMRHEPLRPLGEHTLIPTAGCGATTSGIPRPPGQERAPFQTLAKFDSEYRSTDWDIINRRGRWRRWE